MPWGRLLTRSGAAVLAGEVRPRHAQAGMPLARGEVEGAWGEWDLGRCQAPGCSRSATHAFHVVPRSQGGSDDPSNLVSVCTAHHLRGIHAGTLRILGRAPGGLAWAVALA